MQDKVAFTDKLQKNTLLEFRYATQSLFLSQSASTDSAAFTDKSTYVWWPSPYNKKTEKFVKIFEEIFIAHHWTLESKYMFSYGTKMTVQIDQKIFGQKKNWGHTCR